MKKHSQLVFEETFQGNSLNDQVWNFEVGPKWANQEKQCYVNDRKNYQLSKDGLRIIADLNPDVACRYQSIRLNTKGKKEWQYGTFVIRAKIPQGQGTWPAIWFLGHDIKEVGWPTCGEIDLMETVGRDPGVMHFSLHSKAHNHIQRTQRTFFTSVPGILEGYHDYEMIWRPEGISFAIDGKHYVTFSKTPEEQDWPFDKPYYLIANIAVGGTWGGAIDESTLPYIMDIASIKVYQE